MPRIRGGPLAKAAADAVGEALDTKFIQSTTSATVEKLASINRDNETSGVPKPIATSKPTTNASSASRLSSYSDVKSVRPQVSMKDGEKSISYISRMTNPIDSNRRMSKSVDRFEKRKHTAVGEYRRNPLKNLDHVDSKDSRNHQEAMFVHCANGVNAKVLRLDKQFIVVNKPNGVLSQPDATGDEPLGESVAKFLKEHYKKPGNAYVGVVHRVDRPASGVTVLATTSKAASRLAEQVRERLFKKDYLAVVPKKHLRNKTDGVVQGTEEAGDLFWKEVFQVENTYSILHIKIDTGRKHQIRRQLSQAGIGPIIGDMRYHSSFRPPRDFPSSKGVMLHASRISFMHPTRPEELITVSCPPPWPKDFIPFFYRNSQGGRPDGRSRRQNTRRFASDDDDI